MPPRTVMQTIIMSKNTSLILLLAAICFLLTCALGQQLQQTASPESAQPAPDDASPSSDGSKMYTPYAATTFAQGCNAANLQSWPLASEPIIPALKEGERPNFIVILVDDMGLDDIGAHHPRGPDGLASIGAQTPNIDRLIRRGSSFRSFYTAPLCAMSRAELLTGREYLRTGTVYNTLGYDSFSLAEATAGDVMQQAGYMTGHFGKWHNGRTQGYEPWHRGFNESWLPSDYINLDNLMRHNGVYEHTEGLMEQVLMDKMLGFLKQREVDRKPFFTYYAPFSVHKSPREEMPHGGSALDLYFAPEPYLREFLKWDPRPNPNTARLWAMLKYFDEVVGRLLQFLERSPLGRNTYVLLAGDNGPAVPKGVYEDPFSKLRRMPSGMLGHKGYWDPLIEAAGSEGGMRNHLTVAGPGVPSGAVHDTLLSLADVLPTIADLGDATATKHLPWSGNSFANLLRHGGRPTKPQQERFFFSMVASGDARSCPHAARLMTVTLPNLGRDRQVAKPQPDLAYVARNGSAVFKNCVAGRWKEYKWYGCNNKVFKFTGDSRIELACNEVAGAERQRIADIFDREARVWWASIVAEPHSFTKLVFHLGLEGEKASNVETSGAIQVTRGNVHVKGSAVNFTAPGDRVCCQVQVDTPGRYDVGAMYYSRSDAYAKGDGVKMEFDFKISVGTNQQIKAGSVPEVRGTLRQLRGMTTKSLGILDLPQTPPNTVTEVCAQLTAMHSTSEPVASRDGRPVPNTWFFHLFNLRFVLQQDGQGGGLPPGSAAGLLAADNAAAGSASAVAVAAGQARSAVSPPVGMPADMPVRIQAEPARYQHFQPTPNMIELEMQLRAAAVAAGGAAVWPDGQLVFESMYRPCVSREENDMCMEDCGLM
ncbi:alkaline-phosphatase-like protein [Scenedesmus sp. NREL 46B-D3]|nr:alkaline-phosphatase-like protein [Scenedesmus sp. NREL 46B-D3]